MIVRAISAASWTMTLDGNFVCPVISSGLTRAVPRQVASVDGAFLEKEAGAARKTLRLREMPILNTLISSLIRVGLREVAALSLQSSVR